MFTRVTPKHLFLGCRPAFAPARERLQQSLEPLARFRMIERGMESREPRMRQDVDRRSASAISSSERSPRARPTR
jgi:hypothetical protein